MAFAAGVVYGVGEALVMSVVDLVRLLVDLALAQAYELNDEETFLDKVFRSTPIGTGLAVWRGEAGGFDMLRSLQPGSLINGVMSAGISEAIDETVLKEAWERRNALMEVVEYAVANPGETLGKLVDDYKKKWDQMLDLLKSTEVTDQFEAGKLFGPMLLDIIGLITGVVGFARFAASAPAKVQAALKVLRNSLDDIGSQMRRARLPKPQAASAVDKPLKGSGSRRTKQGSGSADSRAPATRAKADDATSSSAPSPRKQSGGAGFGDAADDAYEAIRRSETDVDAISKNTGVKKENVGKGEGASVHQGTQTRPVRGTWYPAGVQALRFQPGHRGCLEAPGVRYAYCG